MPPSHGGDRGSIPLLGAMRSRSVSTPFFVVCKVCASSESRCRCETRSFRFHPKLPFFAQAPNKSPLTHSPDPSPTAPHLGAVHKTAEAKPFFHAFLAPKNLTPARKTIFQRGSSKSRSQIVTSHLRAPSISPFLTAFIKLSSFHLMSELQNAFIMA